MIRSQPLYARPVPEDPYRRLYLELHASRFDSAEANAAVEQLGAPARAIRALATVRQHNFASARADLLAARAAPELAPIVELVLGVGLFASRDYDLALTTLARAADRGKPGIAKQARMIAQHFARALGWTEEGPARPSEEDGELHRMVVDARALATRGEFRQAGDLLERARAEAPYSVTIVLELALARHQQAPHTFAEGLERRFDDLLEWAPGLISDAAAELGVALWTDQGVQRDRDTVVALLECARRMLTDEVDLERPRYRVRDRLRQVPPVDPQGPSPLARLHAEDRPLIDRVEAVLVKALGIKPPKDDESVPQPSATPNRRPAIWKPRHLSPAQIEQFLVDGFLIVPRAFDPEVARAWREDANRRIREEPEKWIRGYDPNDEARNLRNYSPDDPSTWTWGRIDLHGPETVVIEEFAPAAWATACDLLGGPDRIKTRTWTNYLIINLCDEIELGLDTPAPGAPSWHIDDPSPATRLDRITNGLIGIALFDRLLPSSGNTWVAPDSVGLVARDLAAHPEGVDYVVQRGTRITAQCKRFHEFVGEAGDVLLMHPLMMHSASPNRSGRIRWMGNPMIYLHEPLNPFRPVEELSPVELAIHRAIQ